MPRDWLAVYAILVEHAGAPNGEHDAAGFEFHVLDGCEEWRFGGLLGFGGKFWPKRMAVTCYPEDATPARKQTIARTNAALAEIDT